MVNRLWIEVLNLLPGLLFSIVILFIFYIFGKNFARLVNKRLYARTNDMLLSNFLAKISKWILIILGFIISMQILGWATLASGIITGAGVSAIIIGIAFKNIGENFLSGFLLAFNRPFKIGDLIDTSGYSGTITSMDFRTTNIKTADGQDVFIPNSMIINNPLINYTKDGMRRFEFSIQLNNSGDIERAKVVIINVLNNIDEILKIPLPLVILDQASINIILKIYFWIDALKTERTILEVKSDALENSSIELIRSGIVLNNVTGIRITNDSIPIKLSSNKIKIKK